MNLKLMGYGIGAAAVLVQMLYVDYLSGKVDDQKVTIESMQVNAATMRRTIEEMGAWTKATDAELKRYAETVRIQEQAFRVLKQKVAKAYEDDGDAKDWGNTPIPESLRRLLSEGRASASRGHEASNDLDAVRK